MLTGSVAATYYAAPRATQDIDVVISAEVEEVARVVQGCREAGWYADEGAAEEAARTRGRFVERVLWSHI